MQWIGHGLVVPDMKEHTMVKIAIFTQMVNQKACLPVSYQQMHGAVLRGNVPATLHGGRWMVDPAHVEATAAFFDAQPRNRRSAGVAAGAAA